MQKEIKKSNLGDKNNGLPGFLLQVLCTLCLPQDKFMNIAAWRMDSFNKF